MCNIFPGSETAETGLIGTTRVTWREVDVSPLDS